MSKSKKLVLKKSAPDEVKISFGMEYDRTFRRGSEPFSVDAEFADAILRTSDDFMEFEEVKPEPATVQT